MMPLHDRATREVRHGPWKWRKYDLLDLYGLTNIDYVRKTIRRFHRTQRSQFLAHPRKLLRSGENSSESFYVTKLVPDQAIDQ